MNKLHCRTDFVGAIASDNYTNDATTSTAVFIGGHALSWQLRRRTAAQRAVLAAIDSAGELTINSPTLGQLAALYGISRPTLNKARALSPEKRLRVLAGTRPLDMPQDRMNSAAPKARNDTDVVQFIVEIGPERVRRALDWLTAPMSQAAE